MANVKKRSLFQIFFIPTLESVVTLSEMSWARKIVCVTVYIELAREVPITINRKTTTYLRLASGQLVVNLI